MSHETPRLYNALNISTQLDVSRSWVLAHARRKGSGAPKADYQLIDNNGKVSLLWNEDSLVKWRAYQAGTQSTPKVNRYSSFSDHNAVNQVGYVTVSWKLWWHGTHDGGTCWWFSTLDGWFTSTNEGVTWEATNEMVRPNDRRYFSVTSTAGESNSSLNSVLRSANQLRSAVLQRQQALARV